MQKRRIARYTDIRSQFLKNSSVENHLFAAITGDGNTAIIYVPERQDVELDLTKMIGTGLNAWWYDPASGKSTDGGTIDQDTSVKLTLLRMVTGCLYWMMLL